MELSIVNLFNFELNNDTKITGKENLVAYKYYKNERL